MGKLNKKQEEAVCAKGNVLVKARAGTGKSTIIIERAIHLLKEGVTPSKIKIIAYNVDASKELLDRIKLKEKEQEEILYSNLIQVSTIHSWCLFEAKKIYKRKSKRLSIIKSWQQSNFIKDFLRKNYKPFSEAQIQFYLNEISIYKNSYRQKKLDDFTMSLLKYYEREKNRKHLIDFDDMLLIVLDELNENKNYVEEFEQEYEYLMCDEFQDSNEIMYEIMLYATNINQEMFCVGDSNQSIYEWRGCSSKIMDRFVKERNAKEIDLNITYRNSNNLLRIIEPITSRYNKEKMNGNKEDCIVNINYIEDEQQQAEQIVKSIKKLKNDIAVISRTNANLSLIELSLLKEDIPYQVLGQSFFEKKPIQKAISYLKILQDPINHKNIRHYLSIFNYPVRFIPKKEIDEFITFANAKKNCLSSLSFATDRKMQGFIQELNELIQLKKQAGNVYLRALKKMLMKATQNSFENGIIVDVEKSFLEYFFDTIMQYDSVDDFFKKFKEHIEHKEQNAKVKLMTIHKSKGLEFDNVIIISCNKGVFPHNKSENHNEELNLFYVASTRTKRNLQYFCYGDKSEFLEEYIGG